MTLRASCSAVSRKSSHSSQSCDQECELFSAHCWTWCSHTKCWEPGWDTRVVNIIYDSCTCLHKARNKHHWAFQVTVVLDGQDEGKRVSLYWTKPCLQINNSITNSFGGFTIFLIKGNERESKLKDRSMSIWWFQTSWE